MNLRKDLPLTFNMTIGGVRIALVHTKIAEDGAEEIFDYFSERLITSYTVDEIRHFVPPHATMDKDGWATVSNINFDDVLPSFERVYTRHNDVEIFSVANNTLLSILLAYDSTHKISLLETGVKLAEWLFKECAEEAVPFSIRLINLLQVVRRSRELSKEERLQLLEIAEDVKEDERIRVGAYLLLMNQEAAEMHFAKMDVEMQNSFREWPIYHFWKADDKPTADVCDEPAVVTTDAPPPMV